MRLNASMKTIEKRSVAVILLNWRGAQDTIDCIVSLLSAGIDLRDIIVIDNNSKDNSIENISNAFKSLDILESDHNGGFAYGCNIGIKTALKRDYEYIWLLNNDTLVNCQTLPQMLEIFSKDVDSNIGIVGSLIRYLEFPYDIQAIGGGRVNRLTGQTKNILETSQIEKIDYITGASMLVSKKVFEQIGLLDEKYFMYWEDVEFCIRAKKFGFGIAVAANSLVLHKEGASIGSQSSKKTLIQNKAQTRFFRANSIYWPLILFINSFGRSIKSLLRGDVKTIKYFWMGRL